jgi:hypothetical protein
LIDKKKERWLEGRARTRKTNPGTHNTTTLSWKSE